MIGAPIETKLGEKDRGIPASQYLVEVMRDSVVGGLRLVSGAMVLLGAAHSAAAAEATRMRALGEGLEIGAAISASQVSNDNFFYEQTDPTEVEGLVIHPSLRATQKFTRSFLDFNLGGQWAQFDVADSDSDYFDSQVDVRYSYDGGVRSGFDLGLSSHRGHDPFGIERTAGNAVAGRELDEWIRNRILGSYRYGAPSALLNLEFEAEYLTKDYTTNESATQFLDYDKLSLSQLLFVNLSPKTALLLELNEEVIDFDRESSAAQNRDAEELRVRAGLRWKATAKTTGDLRAGATRRTLDDSGRRVIEGASWLGKITWEPLSRTTVTLISSRSSQEAVNDDVTVIDNRRNSVSFSQGWGRNFRTVASAGVGTSDFVGTNRMDDLDTYGLSLIYSFRRSLSIYADLVRSERDSNVDGLDFVSNSANIGIRVSP